MRNNSCQMTQQPRSCSRRRSVSRRHQSNGHRHAAEEVVANALFHGGHRHHHHHSSRHHSRPHVPAILPVHHNHSHPVRRFLELGLVGLFVLVAYKFLHHFTKHSVHFFFHFFIHPHPILGAFLLCGILVAVSGLFGLALLFGGGKVLLKHFHAFVDRLKCLLHKFNILNAPHAAKQVVQHINPLHHSEKRGARGGDDEDASSSSSSDVQN